jgi:hypothetical protein
MRHGLPVRCVKRGERNKAYRLHVQRAHFATRSSILRDLTTVCLALYYTDTLAAAVPGHVDLLAGFVKTPKDGGDTINDVLQSTS